MLKKLVARGGLYTIASPGVIAAEVAADELQYARIVRPEIRQSFTLVVSARRRASAAVQAVAQLVRELALPAGRGRSLRSIFTKEVA